LVAPAADCDSGTKSPGLLTHQLPPDHLAAERVQQLARIAPDEIRPFKPFERFDVEASKDLSWHRSSNGNRGKQVPLVLIQSAQMRLDKALEPLTVRHLTWCVRSPAP
jgi:hypothetical protein